MHSLPIHRYALPTLSLPTILTHTRLQVERSVLLEELRQLGRELGVDTGRLEQVNDDQSSTGIQVDVKRSLKSNKSAFESSSSSSSSDSDEVIIFSLSSQFFLVLLHLQLGSLSSLTTFATV